MSTVRRLYLYGVSAIALTLVCLGASQLLRLALEQVTGAVPLGSESVNQSSETGDRDGDGRVLDSIQ